MNIYNNKHNYKEINNIKFEKKYNINIIKRHQIPESYLTLVSFPICFSF